MNPQELLKERLASYGDWRGETLAVLAKVVAAADPELVLEWKWDTAVWSKAGLVVAIGGFKDNVGINFLQGASLKDEHKLFNFAFESKKNRSIRYHEGDNVDEAKLTDLIHEAVEFNLSKSKK